MRHARVHLSLQFFSFALIGVLGTGIHYLVLIALVSGAALSPVVATTIGALCGAVINYILNYRLTFRSKKSHSETAVKFFLVAGFGLAINAAIVDLGIRLAEWHFLVSQVVATGVVLFWGFAINKIWTFSGNGNGNGNS